MKTDFAGDESKWNVVQSLVVFRYAKDQPQLHRMIYTFLNSPQLTVVRELMESLAVLLVSLAVYIYGTTCNEGCREDTVAYISFGLVLTSATSIAAVVVSLNTYALDHQFYTGGAYYVKVRPFFLN
jgi:hypothetical protein